MNKRKLKYTLLLLLLALVVGMLAIVYVNRKHFIVYEKWNVVAELDNTWQKNETEGSARIFHATEQSRDNSLLLAEDSGHLMPAPFTHKPVKVVQYTTQVHANQVHRKQKVKFGIRYSLGFKIALNGEPVLYSPNLYPVPSTDTLDFIYTHKLTPSSVVEWFVLPKLELSDSTNTLTVSYYTTENIPATAPPTFRLEASKKGLSLKPFKFTSAPVVKPETPSTLPKIIIRTDKKNIPDEPKIEGIMVISNTDSAEETFSIKIEKRGTSSQRQSFKNSYSVNTYTLSGKKKVASLLGLAEDRKWVLYAPYYDKSLIRNALTYTLGNYTENYCPSVRKCEVFVNDEYKGVYYLTEKITDKKEGLNIKKDGFLAQIDRPEKDEFGFYMPNSAFKNHPYISFVSPDLDKLSPGRKQDIQMYFNDIDALFNDSSHLDAVWDLVDIHSFVDLFIFNELAQNIDAYRLSTFLYRLNNKMETKLKFGPLWDFNHGYGNCLPTPPFEGWAFALNNATDQHTMLNWWENAFAHSPLFREILHRKWQLYRSSFLSDAQLITTIEGLANEGADATQRNFTKLQILDSPLWWNKYAGGSYENEIFYLKCWVLKRTRWMDSQINAL